MIRIIDDVASFCADEAWGAREVAEFDGVTERLHWTDKPYRWHVNAGTEVFVVLAGEVDMRYRQDGEERSVRLRPRARSDKWEPVIGSKRALTKELWRHLRSGGG